MAVTRILRPRQLRPAVAFAQPHHGGAALSVPPAATSSLRPPSLLSPVGRRVVVVFVVVVRNTMLRQHEGLVEGGGAREREGELDEDENLIGDHAEQAY